MLQWNMMNAMGNEHNKTMFQKKEVIDEMRREYDFPVEMYDLTAFPKSGLKDNDVSWSSTHVPQNMAQAVVRTDTNAVLGVHTGSYKLVPHSEIVDKINAAVIASGLSNNVEHTVETFENGAKLRGKFRFHDITVKDPVIGDMIRFDVDYLNSYDGQWSIMMRAQGYRLWCDNGCASPNPLTFDRRKHTAGFSVEGSAEKIKNSVKIFHEDRERWETWSKQKLEIPNVQELLEKTLCKSTTATTKSKVNQTRLENIMGQYRKEVSELGANKWALYNACTYWASHAGDKRWASAQPHRSEVLRHAEVTKLLNSPLWEAA